VSVWSRLASLHAEARATIGLAEFREGVRDAIPIAMGVAAWAIVAGVAMAKSEMGVPLAIFMAVVVYAGSAQVAALPLIVAGAPMWVVWVTTLCVCLRFLAYGQLYRPYFPQISRGRRVAMSYLMGDTNFALFVRRFPQPVPGHPHHHYFLGSALTSVAVWQIFCITGILVGHGVPTSWGLGFAGTMALLALICTQLRNPSSWAAAIVAGCAAVTAYALPMKLNILAAIAAAIAVAVLTQHARLPRSKAGT